MIPQNLMPCAVLAAGIALLAYPYSLVLPRLLDQWLTDPEMAHAILVPPAVALLIARRWRHLLQIPAAGSWWGLPILALGTSGFAFAVWGGGLFLAAVAALFSLVGLVSLTLGWQMLRVLAAPLSLILFGLPRLAVIYDAVTNPLQQTSATLATSALRTLNISATSSGSIITVSGYPVLLAESCSGLRFLLPLLFLATVVWQSGGYPLRSGVILLVSAVPLAILANATRVAILVYLAGTHHGVPPESVHNTLGYPLYALALALMLLLVRRLRLAETAA